MRYKTDNRSLILITVSLLFLLTGNFAGAQNRKPAFVWEPRKDLNIVLPASVRMYETNGLLPDGAPIRAMYATIDLRDENLKLRAVGSNTVRETTLETYQRHNAILAINGGYFASHKSESILVSDGELVAAGPTNFTRGAFGLVNRKPQIVWPYASDSTETIFHLTDPLDLKKDQNLLLTKKRIPWHPAQAVGGGPVLVKAGRIRDTSHEEGFGESHLKRHPRTAIGYINEHTLVLMVVDGRQQSSAGVTIKELAQIMVDAGCYEAVNLDGGGSSAMIAADEVVNVPVDIPNGNRHSLRKNGSALVLTEVIPSHTKEVIIVDTDSEDYQETGIWKSTNHVNFYGDTPSREALTNQVNKAVYNFVNIKPDSFQLSVWWTVNENNTSRGAFILHHGNSVDSIKVDQTSFASNGRWNVLGSYYISPGDYLEVIGEPDQAKKLITDAIRLVRAGHLHEQPQRGDLRIAVISDLNSGLGSAAYEWQVDSIIQRIPRCWKPDLVLCGGDMVAGMGVSDTATLTKMWNGFDEHIAGPLRKEKIPFAFTIGNHDGLRSYPSERKAITDYWTDPRHHTGLRFVDRNHFPHYYSFQTHDAFFVSWDASSSEITKENLSWLSGQFERPEAKNARFRFVIGHLPIYSVAQERDSKGNVLENGEELRRMLERHHVKVYISGHQHAYYPGKRGGLQLLNCGAAGSGPRRWLSLDKPPVNTLTIMDVFYEKDTITYTTYDIKHREARKMPVVDYHELPSSIAGVNGFLIRNDLRIAQKAQGVFFSSDGKSHGTADVVINQNTITVTGNFISDSKLVKRNDAVTFRKGKHAEQGEVLFTIPVKSKNQKSGIIAGSFEVAADIAESMSAGIYHILIQSEKAELRAQLYPATNTAPEQPVITSHNSRNIYGIRNSKGLYRFSWASSRDKDGDFVSYIYQMATDSLFNNILLQQHTGRESFFKKAESEIYTFSGNAGEGQARTLYHRVIATDGKHIATSDVLAIHLLRSNESLTEFIELEPEPYAFDGKIENASGQGAGALWDKNGKLWLADYGGSLYAKLPDGKDASFSPVRSAMVNNKSYSLKPINGIGTDLDGHILVASNRQLIKLNANTGEGIAVWEVPEGKRAITTPRVNDKGEIYAMSLFAEDPNYVLRQGISSPGTFELVRTISLPQRILARTFDMSADGLTLYFPDPGGAIIQTFTSKDGVSYRRGEDITSTAAGCNGLKTTNGKVFAAVRPSGISGATLHFRDEKEKVMWTLSLPELDGAEARGLAVSDDYETLIICTWDKGGGFYRYKKIKK
jgi:predicted phosphodiesterase/ribosomal 50S subunit-recycling heat shock protein